MHILFWLPFCCLITPDSVVNSEYQFDLRYFQCDASLRNQILESSLIPNDSIVARLRVKSRNLAVPFAQSEFGDTKITMQIEPQANKLKDQVAEITLTYQRSDPKTNEGSTSRFFSTRSIKWGEVIIPGYFIEGNQMTGFALTCSKALITKRD